MTQGGDPNSPHELSRTTLLEIVDRLIAARHVKLLAVAVVLVSALLFVVFVFSRFGGYFLVATAGPFFLILALSSLLEERSFRTLSRVQANFVQPTRRLLIGAFGSLLIAATFPLMFATEAWVGLLILGFPLWIVGEIGSASGVHLLSERYYPPYLKRKDFVSAVIWPVGELRGLREFQRLLREASPIDPSVRDLL